MRVDRPRWEPSTVEVFFAVVLAIPFVVVPIYLTDEAWVRWLAPLVYIGTLYTAFKLTSAVRDRGAPDS